MERPFEGIKVADFSWVIVGPVTTRYLADYGATVVRIESSTRPDLTRTMRPFKDEVPGFNRGTFFPRFNCNKYSLSLDLNNPLGLQVAKRIVAWADIVVENFTPEVMERWGLNYEELVKIKPDIIMLSSSGQGQTGPRARHPSYGMQLSGLAGFTELCGWPEEPPLMPFGAYTDPVSYPFCAAALIAALDYRRRTGKGQYFDLSQYEASIFFLLPLVLDFTVNRRSATRQGNRCPDAAPHGVYPCRGTDRWCAIEVYSDEEWHGFCEAVGGLDWTKDPKFATLMSRKRNEAELDKLVGEWTANFAAEQVMERLQAFGVGSGVVQNCEDVFEDPQLHYREHFWMLNHPEIGQHSYDTFPFRLSKSSAEPRMPGPCLGEHNEYVCTELIGMSDEEFARLMSEGVFE